MTVISRLSVRMPKWRLRVMRIVIFFIAPFVRRPETGAKIAEAMLRWVCRGLKVYDDGRRIG